MQLDVSTGFCITTWTGFWRKDRLNQPPMATEISKWIAVAAAIEKTMVPPKQKLISCLQVSRKPLKILNLNYFLNRFNTVRITRSSIKTSQMFDDKPKRT